MSQITLASGPRLDEDNPTARWQERRRFRGALFLSALGHALVLALLLLSWQPTEETVPLPAIPVTLVRLGQSGAAGGGNSVTAASSPNTQGEAASAPSAPSDAEPQATQTVSPEPQPTPPTPPETTPQPAPEVPTLAQTSAAPTPAQQQTIEPVPPRKPVPPHPRPPAPEMAAAAPPAATTPAPPQRQAAQAPTTGSQMTNSAPSSDALAPGVGGRGRGEAGPGRAAVGNGSPNGPGDDYLDAVRRWVNRFRKYPEEAIKEKQEGTVQLGFRFTRDGTILDVWIVKSSGFPLLDQAALAMIHAASPIPKVPDQYKGDTLTLQMPENFRIGLLDRLFD